MQDPSPIDTTAAPSWVDNTTAGLERAWYAVALSRDVGDQPHQVHLLGKAWIVLRFGDQLRAFADRCPHRLAPLSLGTNRGDHLQCRYHGWEFAPDGRLTAVPALGEDVTATLREPGLLALTYSRSQVSAPDLLARAARAGLDIADISTEEPDLEEVFLALTSSRAPEPD